MKILPFLLLPIVSGCALYPVAGYDRAAMIDRGIKEERRIKEIDTIEEARQLAHGWRITLQESAVNRERQKLVAGEVLYYGTLVLAVSQAAILAKGANEINEGWRRGRNIGAGAGLAANLFTQHYQPEGQRVAFERAERKMRCVTDALAGIDPDTRALFSEADFAGLQTSDNRLVSTLFDAIPRQVVSFVEDHSVPQLRAALADIVLTQSRDELLRVAQDWERQRNIADASQKKNNALLTKDNRTALVQSLTDAPAAADGTKAAAQALAKKIGAMSAAEVVDRKRRFQSAVIAFSATLETCKTVGQ